MAALSSCLSHPLTRTVLEPAITTGPDLPFLFAQMPLSLSLEYLVLDLAALSLFTYVVRTWLADRSRRQGLQYPPGPRGIPILGNLFDIPQRQPWETYTRWGKQYGMQTGPQKERNIMNGAGCGCRRSDIDICTGTLGRVYQ